MFQALLRAAAGHRSFIAKYVTSTLSMVVGLLAHSVGFIVVARALGSEQFGRLTLITTTLMLGLAWCGLGSGELLRRRVARDPVDYPDCFGHALLVLLATGVTLSLALAGGLAFSVTVSSWWLGNFGIMFLFAISNLLLFPLTVLSEQVLLAHDKVTLANGVNLGAGVGRASAAVIAYFCFSVSDLATWAFWHFGFNIICCSLSLTLIARFGRPRLVVLWDELGRGLSVSLTGLFVVVRQNVDVLALGVVTNASDVGVYSVARRLVATASVVSASFDRLVYSAFAVAGKNGPIATYALAQRYAVLVVGLCAVTTLAVCLVAPFVPIVFGQQYEAAVTIIRILSGTLMLTGLHWLASDALNACEQHRQRLYAETSAGTIGLAVLVGLTFAYGLSGILIAIYIAGGLVAAALWATLRHLARTQTVTVGRHVQY